MCDGRMCTGGEPASALAGRAGPVFPPWPPPWSSAPLPGPAKDDRAGDLHQSRKPHVNPQVGLAVNFLVTMDHTPGGRQAGDRQITGSFRSEHSALETLSAPETVSPHATWAYSWIRVPSRSAGEPGYFCLARALATHRSAIANAATRWPATSSMGNAASSASTTRSGRKPARQPRHHGQCHRPLADGIHPGRP